MRAFRVEKAVFDQFPDYCVGVVVAKGLRNDRPSASVGRLQDGEAARFQGDHQADNVRELPGIAAYREAFLKLGMNPNKFMCSIEALAKRVQKGGVLPHINPVVDLGNAFSVKYQLPMGAHDVDKLTADLEIRFSVEGDHFLPMGESGEEAMPAGELVYVSGHTVKTRRWLWRQSEDGKIGGETSHVFFPLDGFEGVNGDAVLAARDELAALLEKEFNAEVTVGYVNAAQPVFPVGD